jgi:eukaryotic-like serine/threonine-protein kinase
MLAEEKTANDSQSLENADRIQAPGAAHTVDPEAVLPRRLGRLTLLKQIARGGMGEVLLATTGEIEGAERPCVVKIIRREHADDRSFLARFLDEARIQAQLQHPGVAQILDATTDPSGKPYVVVEYVEGRNLGELRTRAIQLGARMAWPDAVAIGVALAEALSFVHERTDAAGKPLEIVHRDLSPQNIMVGYDGDVKLIDFGTARGENRRCHTVSGIVFAKPGYVAPEVANNHPGGVQADIYAFGVMLWELLAARRFLSGDPSEHMVEVAAGRRNPPPVAASVEAPPELDAIIARMTAHGLEQRYESVRDAMVDLAGLLKRAPSLPDGERSVRARISHVIRRLYPAEPARSRAEFARLVAQARSRAPKPEAAAPSPPPPAAAQTPSVLAGTRYRLIREIGRGGMGVVYEAFHVDLNRAVALKVLPKERAASPQFAERFRAEARAIARLRNDNLVALHDFGLSSDQRPYYAMELLDGESLERHLDREKGMDWREAARLGMQACDALETAHQAGVIHRDIKPGNLFLTRSGKLKLLDFGIAAMGEAVDSSEASPGALAVVGTPEYMAPEQIRREAADPRTDIYSLGTVLYELVTGTRPYLEASTVGLLDAKLRQDPEPPRDRAPKRGLPAMLDETIERALARDPALRFQSAEEMREALAAALHEPFRARQRRRRAGFATLGVVALALCALVVVGVKKPEIRARAIDLASPVLQKARELRAEVVRPAPAPIAAAATPAQPAPAAVAAPEPTVDDGAPQADDENAAPDRADEDGEPAAPDGEVATAEDADEANQADPAVAAPSPAVAPPATDTVRSADLDRQLEEVSGLLAKGNRIRGLNRLRELGRSNPQHPQVLRLWSETAAGLRGWGEAHKVAVQWAAVDQSAAARLHLARMQRAVGKHEEAVKTVSQLVQDQPTCIEAQELLRQLQGRARLAMQ